MGRDLAEPPACKRRRAGAGEDVDVGRPLEELDTPALLVDLDALEHNIAAMAEHILGAGCLWRPHCKALRAAPLARRLVDAGACGVTCAKLSQAEALVNSGIADVLIANEVVGARKISALVELARRAVLCVAVDDAENLREISAAAVAAGLESIRTGAIAVLVDVDIGMARCGVHWSRTDEITALCRLAVELPGITFRGLMGYEGHAQGLAGEAKAAESTVVAERFAGVKKVVTDAGLEVPLVSGAGSGNYFLASRLGATTEVQAGGAALFCQTYERFHAGQAGAPRHRPALSLLCQVVSVAGLPEGRCVGDAGFKSSFPLGGGLPKVLGRPGLAVTQLNAEHCVFEVAEGTAAPRLGERICLQPHYSDATTLLHRRLYAVRAGHVVEAWSLEDSIGQLW